MENKQEMEDLLVKLWKLLPTLFPIVGSGVALYFIRNFPSSDQKLHATIALVLGIFASLLTFFLQQVDWSAVMAPASGSAVMAPASGSAVGVFNLEQASPKVKGTRRA